MQCEVRQTKLADNPVKLIYLLIFFFFGNESLLKLLLMIFLQLPCSTLEWAKYILFKCAADISIRKYVTNCTMHLTTAKSPAYLRKNERRNRRRYKSNLMGTNKYF